MAASKSNRFLEAWLVYNICLSTQPDIPDYQGGYYKIDLAGRKLQLVALNTALYLSSNHQTRHSYHHDPANQWHWLENILEKARLKHQTVSVFYISESRTFQYSIR